MLALLYDVHGNLPALEAVLADCPAERFLLGGDYAVAGAWPRETVARLEELDGELDSRQRRPLARRHVGRARADAPRDRARP